MVTKLFTVAPVACGIFILVASGSSAQAQTWETYIDNAPPSAPAGGALACDEVALRAAHSVFRCYAPYTGAVRRSEADPPELAPLSASVEFVAPTPVRVTNVEAVSPVLRTLGRADEDAGPRAETALVGSAVAAPAVVTAAARTPVAPARTNAALALPQAAAPISAPALRHLAEAAQQTPSADAAGEEANLSTMTAGYTFFNRPGADTRTHDEEVSDCAAEAARTVSVDEQLHNGAGQGLAGAIFGGYLQRAYHRGAAAAGLENCMVVRGWRVVKLDDAEGAPLAAAPAEELARRLAPWIGSPAPPGRVARTYHNDAANAAVTRFAIRPGHSSTQLSLKATTGMDITQFTQASTPPDSTRDVIDKRWPKKPLTAQSLASAPADGGVVMIQIKGQSLRGGTGVELTRIGDFRDIRPSRSDHAPDKLLAEKGFLLAHREGDMLAFAAPAGRWRIAAFLGGMKTLNLCLGAPAFEVKAGETVYAGAFDLSAAQIGPDLDLAPARRWLDVAGRRGSVRPASYVNGTRGVCGDNAIYAFEIKNAPYEPGYAWGGAATSATTLATAAP